MFDMYTTCRFLGVVFNVRLGVIIISQLQCTVLFDVFCCVNKRKIDIYVV